MEETFWRETATGTFWRITDARKDGDGFDVSFFDAELGEDPRDIDEDALWEARLYEPQRETLKEAA
jgi:hypothetical protein